MLNKTSVLVVAILHFAFSYPQSAVICLTLLSLGTDSFAHEQAVEPAAAAEANSNADSNAECKGVSLGDFRIRSYYPADAQKSTVRFTLYAAVKADHLAEARKLVEEHREKLRDQILTATRLAPLTVFQEPDLTNFRRRVLVRIRRALPELAVEDLYVSDFDLTIKSL